MSVQEPYSISETILFISDVSPQFQTRVMAGRRQHWLCNDVCLMYDVEMAAAVSINLTLTL